jgi:hypothetical protein
MSLSSHTRIGRHRFGVAKGIFGDAMSKYFVKGAVYFHGSSWQTKLPYSQRL